jgi:hypothetical protein
MTDNDIERVARKMCEKMGIDPDNTILAGHPDIETDEEQAAQEDSNGMRFVYDVALYVPQWMIYRKDAARAIASITSLNI